ncbi:MAG: DNA polymerase III subunit delta [Pseudomonadota bacterium]
MKIPANRLSSHLREPLLPCYLISGDEPLLVSEATDAIRESARRQGFDSRDLHVQLTGFDWGALAAAGAELSLFASRRIVELRLPTGKPGRDGGAAIVELAGQAGEDLLFVVQTPKLDWQTEKAKWVQTLATRGAHVQVYPVPPEQLPRWLVDRMRAAGLTPDNDCVRIIAERVEGNLLAADQEIQKLRLLHGEGPVSAADAKAAVADSSRFDVYQLADAALAGKPQRALRILDGLQAEGVEIVILAWALTRDVRTLVQIVEATANGGSPDAAMQKLRVWRNRQGLMRACLARHGRESLFGLLKACRHLDAVAKGQLPGDAWQLAINIVWRLATSKAQGSRAAA